MNGQIDNHIWFPSLSLQDPGANSTHLYCIP